MGPDWLERYWESAGHVPAEVNLGSGHVAASGNLVDLALRYHVLDGALGIGQVQRDMRNDLRDERRCHSALQLEVAALAVPGVPRADADPGTVGTAADWLLRFLICPQPELHLVMGGAAACRNAGIDVAPALAGIAGALGVPLPAWPPERVQVFTGPVPGSAADPGLLARSCWALALLTEAFRAGPMIAARGPLGQFRGGSVAGDDLLGLAPPAGLTQLAAFRHVFDTALLPQLAARTGPWALGPTFAGSELIKADADLIAAGLLLVLKTSAKLSLGITDLLQVIGYALLDFDDDYRIAELGIFTARYGYLATWELGGLLSELAGHEISAQSARDEFRGFLLACPAAG